MLPSSWLRFGKSRQKHHQRHQQQQLQLQLQQQPQTSQEQQSQPLEATSSGSLAGSGDQQVNQQQTKRQQQSLVAVTSKSKKQHSRGAETSSSSSGGGSGYVHIISNFITRAVSLTSSSSLSSSSTASSSSAQPQVINSENTTETATRLHCHQDAALYSLPEDREATSLHPAITSTTKTTSTDHCSSLSVATGAAPNAAKPSSSPGHFTFTSWCRHHSKPAATPSLSSGGVRTEAQRQNRKGTGASKSRSRLCTSAIISRGKVVEQAKGATPGGNIQQQEAPSEQNSHQVRSSSPTMVHGMQSASQQQIAISDDTSSSGATTLVEMKTTKTATNTQGHVVTTNVAATPTVAPATAGPSPAPTTLTAPATSKRPQQQYQPSNYNNSNNTNRSQDVILYQVPGPSSIRSQFRLFNDDLLNGSYCNYLEYLKLTLARRRSIVEIRASYPLASTNAKNNQVRPSQAEIISNSTRSSSSRASGHNLEQEDELLKEAAEVVVDDVATTTTTTTTAVSCGGSQRNSMRVHLSLATSLLDLTYDVTVQGFVRNSLNWNFNSFTFDAICGGRSLTELLMHLFNYYNLIKIFNLNIINVLKCFRLLEIGYQDTNPYHNSIHAADVTQAMHCFIQETKIRRHLTHLETMCALLAAVCHDLDHPGVNQTFLIATDNYMAKLYKNCSVLENHHWRFAISIFKDSHIFDHLSKATWLDIESQLKCLILATDIAHQNDYLIKFRQLMVDPQFSMIQFDHRSLVLQIALKCADLGNPCRPWILSKYWSEQICTEFYRQGDYEQQLAIKLTPMCQRNKSSIAGIQSDFFCHIVQPLLELWHKFLQSPLSSLLMSNFEYNYQQWQQASLAAKAKRRHSFNTNNKIAASANVKSSPAVGQCQKQVTPGGGSLVTAKLERIVSQDNDKRDNQQPLISKCTDGHQSIPINNNNNNNNSSSSNCTNKNNNSSNNKSVGERYHVKRSIDEELSVLNIKRFAASPHSNEVPLSSSMLRPSKSLNSLNPNQIINIDDLSASLFLAHIASPEQQQQQQHYPYNNNRGPSLYSSAKYRRQRGQIRHQMSLTGSSTTKSSSSSTYQPVATESQAESRSNLPSTNDEKLETTTSDTVTTSHQKKPSSTCTVAGQCGTPPASPLINSTCTKQIKSAPVDQQHLTTATTTVRPLIDCSSSSMKSTQTTTTIQPKQQQTTNTAVLSTRSSDHLIRKTLSPIDDDIDDRPSSSGIRSSSPPSRSSSLSDCSSSSSSSLCVSSSINEHGKSKTKSKSCDRYSTHPEKPFRLLAQYYDPSIPTTPRQQLSHRRHGVKTKTPSSAAAANNNDNIVFKKSPPSPFCSPKSYLTHSRRRESDPGCCGFGNTPETNQMRAANAADFELAAAAAIVSLIQYQNSTRYQRRRSSLPVCLPKRRSSYPVESKRRVIPCYQYSDLFGRARKNQAIGPTSDGATT